MSILEREITLIGSRGRVECRALFDSGASYSIVRRDIAERIARLEPVPNPDEWVFETAKPGDFIQARYRVAIDFRFRDSEARFSDQFIVFDDMPEQVIIGASTMQMWKIRLNFETETVDYRKTATRLRV